MRAILIVLALVVCASASVYQPITGTFMDVQWYDTRFKYMNGPANNFTCDDWKLKMREMKAYGLDTLIFQTVADEDQSFYISNLRPYTKTLRCSDVLEAIMSEADTLNIRIWLTMEYVHNMWDSITDQKLMQGRLEIMRELAASYVPRHSSFEGWYMSSEACLTPYFSADFLKYMEVLSAEARKLTPKAKIIISPYGTRFAVADDKYINQLKNLDVDVIAYQDEVGCVRLSDPVWASKRAFAALRKAHDAVPKIALWANTESFTWEALPNSQQSALIPAAFPRVLAQNEAVGSVVDKVISFTWQGMYDPPSSPAPWGMLPHANRLYNDYMSWRRGDHDKMLLAEAVHGSVKHAAIGGTPVKFVTQPSPKYNGGNLTDGITCTQQLPYENKCWLGFDKVDMDATLTLSTGAPIEVQELAIYMLQSTPLAIYLPSYVSFYASQDGVSFDLLKTINTQLWEQEKYDQRPELYQLRLDKPVKAKYVRVYAFNQSPSAGKAWVFASEIMVNPVLSA